MAGFRLSLASSNVVRVVNAVTGRHELERIVESLPQRFFVASFPAGEGEVRVRVEPKRATAYVVYDPVRSTVYVLSARRIRVIVEVGDSHVMVPGRLVDKESFEALLLLA